MRDFSPSIPLTSFKGPAELVSLARYFADVAGEHPTTSAPAAIASPFSKSPL